MEEFDYAKDNDAAERDFHRWRKRYPKGFVINRRGNALTLHLADCWHFYEEGPEQISTRRPKYCSANREALEEFAQALSAGPLQYCQHCKPA